MEVIDEWVLDIGNIFLISKSSLQKAFYADSVVMPAEIDQDDSKTVTAVQL